MKIKINNIEVELTKEQVDEIVRQSKGEGKRWRAEKDKMYWFLNENSQTYWSSEYFTNINDTRYYLKNYFKTKEEAEKQQAKNNAQIEIQKYIEDNDLEFEPDWSDFKQEKWFLEYDHRDKMFSFSWSYTSEYIPPFCFKSEEHARQVIDNKTEALKVMWGVN